MRVNHVADAGLLALQRLMLLAPLRAATMATPVEPVVAATPPVALAHSITSVEMLVAIAASDPEARRRRTAMAAEQGLDELDRLLRADRLGGAQAPHLEAMAAWITNHEVPDDAAARSLVDEIELRVLVELAKRQTPAG